MTSMKLIVGLGNPGGKYKGNRHNVGYMFVDGFTKNKPPKNTIVKKTSLFMNSSGEAVRNFMTVNKIKPEDLYIVHDDLDIPLGSYKIQLGKGPKLHYGISSIEANLGTPDFWRVRIGVDNRDVESRIPGEEYVLEDFTQKELVTLQTVLKKATLDLKARIGNG